MFHRIDMQIGGEWFEGREGFKSRKAAEGWIAKQSQHIGWRIVEVGSDDEPAQSSRRRGPKLVEWR